MGNTLFVNIKIKRGTKSRIYAFRYTLEYILAFKMKKVNAKNKKIWLEINVVCLR